MCNTIGNSDLFATKGRNIAAPLAVLKPQLNTINLNKKAS